MIDLTLIKKFEGCRLKAYPDPGSGGKPFTIGWGSTRYENGSPILPGDIISQDRADKMLMHEVNAFELGVLQAVTSQIGYNQLSALVTFAYNVGLGNFRKSTLLKLVNQNPNEPAIKNEFQRWNRAAGKVMRGLTIRRAAEADLYFTA